MPSIRTDDLRAAVIIVLCGLALCAGAWAAEQTADALVKQGHTAFYTDKDYAKAVDIYRRLRDDFPGHPFVKSGDAQFYLSGALTNAGKTQEAIDEAKRFLDNYPDHRACANTLFFLGVNYRKLGDSDRAEAAFRTLLEKHPNDPAAGLARNAMHGIQNPGAPLPPGVTKDKSAGFPDYPALLAKAKGLWTGANTAPGAYAVMVPPSSPLKAAAGVLAAYRHAETINFDPQAPEESLPELIRRNVRWAAVFVEPKDMDVNLVRRFIVLSTLLDSDPFCDFAFGFVTGTTPQQAAAFVQRMIEADRQGIRHVAIKLAMSTKSVHSADSFIPGLPGETYYVGLGDTAFARTAIAQLPRAGAVHIGGCGDPEGIWLFDDVRNRDHSKHWPFDPGLVGQDPQGEMPRITADYFRGLKLDNPVVWTHVCHLGSVGRAFVAGDIVSTFGSSDRLEEYFIPPGRSVALSIIEAGVSAYIAPLGPNHGNQSYIEQAIAFETGVPLGDVLRRSYHDMVMDTNGHPESIGLYVKGKPRLWNPDAFVNHNSPCNRCLYGDPLFSPVKDMRVTPTVSVKKDETKVAVSLDIRVESSGYLGRTLYGNRAGTVGAGRIYETVPLDTAPVSVSIQAVTAFNSRNDPVPVLSQTALLEQVDGRTILHVQLVTSDRTAFREKGAGAELLMTFGQE